MQVVRAHENACVCVYTPNPVHSDACIVAMYIYKCSKDYYSRFERDDSL